MLPRLFLLIIAAIIAYYGYKWFKRELAEKGRPFAVKFTLVSIALLLIVLTVMGRAHWVGAALASLLAGFRFILPWAIRAFPLLQRYLQAKEHLNTESQYRSESKQAPAKQTMTVQEALDVLGLEDNPTEKEIVEAHRKLIQKVHPDRGGNDFLAATINNAKETLIKNIS